MSTKSTFRIQGFKFHQYALDILKEEVYLNHLPASAVATYIGLVSEVSPAGLIPSDLKKSKLATKMQMHKQTIHDGFTELVNRHLIKEVVINDELHYELFGYAAHNKNHKESMNLSKGTISYFEVPNELFNTNVLSDLVKSKEAKGLILLLNLFNHFSRELNKNKKDPAKAPDQLLMSTLKKNLGKCSAKRVRNVIAMLAPLFSFVPEKLEERMPRKELSLRTIVKQIWIRKYFVYINPTCVAQCEETPEETIEAAKAIKDAHYRIKALNIQLKQADKNGIGIAYYSIIKKIARFIKDSKVKKGFLRDSMQDALEQLEQYITKNNEKIKSIGAFINKSLQQYVFNFFDNDKNNISIDVFTQAYNATGASLPTVLVKYQDYKSKHKFQTV